MIEHNRGVFKSFFSCLKSLDEYLQFVFITGVTKFNKVSIFSDLNQLDDITFDNAYAGLCGITENELRDLFKTEIKEMADAKKISAADCLEKLRQTYDGYRFSSDLVGVYNPYSLLRAFIFHKNAYRLESDCLHLRCRGKSATVSDNGLPVS